MANLTAKPRAARVAAPGARRIVFTGVMAAPDGFGRLRVILLERFADGAPDGSWAALARELPEEGPGYSVPYELRGEAQRPADETRGVAWVAVPGRHREHWGRVAESLRGKEVRVEATVRPFRFSKGDGAEVTAGVALDLAMLEPRGSDAP